jgi:hypothetical protein
VANGLRETCGQKQVVFFLQVKVDDEWVKVGAYKKAVKAEATWCEAKCVVTHN